MKINLKEQLKDAISNNDIVFLEKNRDKYSIDERFEDENNDSLLLYAISYKESEAYAFFLKNGANIYLVNDEGENILHAIIYSRDTRRLEDFLNNYEFNLNEVTNEGVTPLLLALSLREIDMALYLIRKGADVNIGDENGVTPLHLAVQDGSLELVESLIKAGANLHLKTKKGNYPLALAINEDQDEIVKYLYPKIYK